MKGGVWTKEQVEGVIKRQFPRHRKWVRGFSCSIQGCPNSSPIEAAHVTLPLPKGKGHLKGGTGQKWHDAMCISLCHDHHMIQHAEGWVSFEKSMGRDAVELAFEFASKSPVQEIRDAVK
jgi:hypothetical protein|tara:strand:+ start:5370 stop:5729 length:360 start_codon:yes stop_codon:yes gene_type:complete